MHKPKPKPAAEPAPADPPADSKAKDGKEGDKPEHQTNSEEPPKPENMEVE